MIGKDYFAVQKMLNLKLAACTGQNFPRDVELRTVLSTGSVYNLAGASVLLFCFPTTNAGQAIPIGGRFHYARTASPPGLKVGDGCQREPPSGMRARGSRGEA